tara:strand:- start:105 stop:350 length:246 start_codon:yes stop_codon:yes gene_type:complete
LIFIDNMNSKEIKNILTEVFPKSKIPKKINGLKINDLKEWDSLGNFNLLLAVEEKYKIKFSMKEISEIKSIKSLLIHLKKK